MHQHAYDSQSTAEENRHTTAKSTIRNPKLTLFALALGTFAIGGAVALGVGWGTLSTVWVGFVLTTRALLLYVTTIAGVRPAPVSVRP